MNGNSPQQYYGGRARKLALLATLLSATFLASCTVGPDFARPKAPDVKSYSADSLPASTASAASRQTSSRKR